MRKRVDINASLGAQFIVTGLARLVEQEGFTPHEAFEILEGIKGDTFHALAELHSDFKKANG